uniref:Cytosolic fatty-acid binding proteins domain-containing protein n=1 Tax=Sander lucioperca TaxID=283035 RepID=A0A8C9XX94_SANLU
MAFTGKYILESQENYKEFLNALGKRPVLTFKKSHQKYNEDFRLTTFLMDNTWSNTFNIGKESDLETLNGETFKFFLLSAKGDVIPCRISIAYMVICSRHTTAVTLHYITYLHCYTCSYMLTSGNPVILAADVNFFPFLDHIPAGICPLV